MQNKYDQPGESSQYTKTAHNWWRLQAVHALREWLKVYSNYSLCTVIYSYWQLTSSDIYSYWQLTSSDPDSRYFEKFNNHFQKKFFNWPYIKVIIHRYRFLRNKKVSWILVHVSCSFLSCSICFFNSKFSCPVVAQYVQKVPASVDGLSQKVSRDKFYINC